MMPPAVIARIRRRRKERLAQAIATGAPLVDVLERNAEEDAKLAEDDGGMNGTPVLSEPPKPKRKVGRPKGSKNKPKAQ